MILRGFLDIMAKTKGGIDMRHDMVMDRKTIDDRDDNFTMEILKDLVAQGYSGDELLEKFAEQRINIRKAVDILINEADEIVAGKRVSASTQDIFGEE